MHIRCPHCKYAIELIDVDVATVLCPSCDSRFTLLEVPTVSFDQTNPQYLEEFILLEVLGVGSFGTVWKARDSQLDRTVAIKLPRHSRAEGGNSHLFLREARAAAQLKHASIVTVHEVGISEGQPYIVSDFVQGVTLAEWLKIKKPSYTRSAELCAKLADALHHAHDAGVIHRDLKPSNILMDESDAPHVTDFGLAKRDTGEITITVDGQIVGTPAYMSPEQARGDGHHVDRRSDVYSLGVIFYELLTGKRPFDGESRLLLHQIISVDATPPRKLDRNVPKDLETICLKALEKDPKRRYMSMEDMAKDLRCFLEARPISARPISSAERGWRWANRNRALAVAGAIAATLLLSAGLLWWRVNNLREALRPHTVNVSLTTQPAGANVVFVPLDAIKGRLQPDKRVIAKDITPLNIDLPPAMYLVVAEVKGYGFHEVYRRIPPELNEPPHGVHRHLSWRRTEAGAIELPDIVVPRSDEALAGMVPIKGGKLQMGASDVPGSPPHLREVLGYYMDAREVTVEDYERVVGELPQHLSEELPGIDSQSAVVYLTFDQALYFAELVGKRLPEEVEYEFAATNGGTSRFPWGDEPPDDVWSFGPVGTPEYDRTSTTPPIYGLYSNAAEWTQTYGYNYYYLIPEAFSDANDPLGARHTQLPENLRLMLQLTRIVRGGPTGAIDGEPMSRRDQVGPRERTGIASSTRHRGLGFRCVRSQAPRFLDNH